MTLNKIKSIFFGLSEKMVYRTLGIDTCLPQSSSMNQNEKIRDFVTHLLSNPNIQNEPVLIAEGIVLNFIISNLDKLKKTFKSPQFFPELSSKEVLALIIADLRNRTIEKVKPKLFSYIDYIDFTVLLKYQKSASYNNDYYRDLFKQYLDEIIQNKDVRYYLNSTLNILSMDVLERYLGESFSKRTPMFFELVRVQKNNLKTEEYVNYLKILLLLRCGAYYKREIPDFSESKVNINDFLKVPKTLEQFFKKRALATAHSLPGVAASIIEMAIKSNVSESLLAPEDSSARLMYILAQRFQHYQEYKKIDRGAESPDKSWFGVMRKNAAYYGFDKRLLEDLYMISGNNNW
ncbi:MAG: hypothetical protein ACOCWH_06550 [Spirochaetota bacterium]